MTYQFRVRVQASWVDPPPPPAGQSSELHGHDQPAANRQFSQECSGRCLELYVRTHRARPRVADELFRPLLFNT